MSEPLVVAIMLTKDRSEMAARAVRAFRKQTYDPTRRILSILDTGAERHFVLDGSDSENEEHDWRPSVRGQSIGALRNLAASWAMPGSILIHWDDDDVSHPNRIAEQVAHLQSSGAEVVGYNKLLFWISLPKFVNHTVDGDEIGGPYADDLLGGEAWLYKAPHFTAPGTSLAYWRKTWEMKPFPDMPNNKQSTGEDVQWLKGMNLATVSSLAVKDWEMGKSDLLPRLIASIHGGNTMSYDLEGMIARGSREWRRTPELDEFCRSRMRIWEKRRAF